MSKAQEAQQFLQDLDNFDPAAAGRSSPAKTRPGEAADVIAFLDEMAQPAPARAQLLDRPGSRAGTPSLRKSTERVRMGVPPSMQGAAVLTRTVSTSASDAAASKPATPVAEQPPQQKPGGWGWGSVWSTASTVVQQAKSVVDEQVKNLPANGVLEYAKTAQEYAKSSAAQAAQQAQGYAQSAQEYAKTAQLDKLGLSASDPACVHLDLTLAQGRTSARSGCRRSARS
jgi:hypothetical protein